jgi:hypothetical protein
MRNNKRLKNIGLSLLISTGFLFTPAIATQTVLAQQVINVNPGLDSENVTPDTSISGVFKQSSGAGIDINSIKIFVNDRDVTNRSTITKDFFSYRPPQNLPSGSNTVRVEYKNTNGQKRVVTWSFTVQEPRSALEITSVTHNAENQALGPGATFLATLNGTPNAQASILLIADGKSIRTLPAKEVSPGIYTATFNVGSGDAIQEGVVIARLQRQNQVIYAAAPQAVVFSNRAGTGTVPEVQPPSVPETGETSNRPLRPLFTNYQNGDRIDTQGFTLVGQTQPNAQVAVRVTSALPVLGGLFNVNVGQRILVDRTVSADSQGNFEIEVPPPPSLVSGLRYTVRAVAANNQQTSQPVEFILIQE